MNGMADQGNNLIKGAAIYFVAYLAAALVFAISATILSIVGVPKVVALIVSLVVSTIVLVSAYRAQHHDHIPRSSQLPSHHGPGKFALILGAVLVTVGLLLVVAEITNTASARSVSQEVSP
jgi:hypothetical protein